MPTRTKKKSERKSPLLWDLLCRIRNIVADADGRTFEGHTVAQQRTFEVILSHAPEGVRLKDVARERGITAGTASVAASALEARGMIRRAAVNGDRRTALLLPTEKSLKKVAGLDALTEKVTRSALRGVPAADRKTCFRVLEKMLENLRAG